MSTKSFENINYSKNIIFVIYNFWSNSNFIHFFSRVVWASIKLSKALAKYPSKVKNRESISSIPVKIKRADIAAVLYSINLISQEKQSVIYSYIRVLGKP